MTFTAETTARKDGLTLPVKPNPVARGHRLGRSAWILHGLAYLFFLSAWGVMLILGESTEESQPVQGVGGAAAIVLSLWSLVLSIRALIAAERPVLPVLNIALVLLEITAPCVAVWWPLLLNYRAFSPVYEIALAWGLPVFVPFMSFGSGIAALFAWWLTGRAERRGQKQGQPAWTQRRRWRWGVSLYAGALAMLACLILPLPLYIFAALSASVAEKGILQNIVLDTTPDFIKLIAYNQMGNGSRGPSLKYRMLQDGRLSDALLLSFFHHKDNSLGNAAWAAYTNRHPEQRLSRAMEIAASPGDFNSTVQYIAGWEVAMDGSPEQIGALFPTAGFGPDPLHDGLYQGLRYSPSKELIPQLAPLLDCKELYARRMATHILAYQTGATLTATPQPGSVPETAQEMSELETVRAAVKKATQR
ncbi:MAG: hypothetical protein HY291_20285 [Planctomycetes bacterium]|nr:hypothetical protein [Planctomycetota bacterium]